METEQKKASKLRGFFNIFNAKTALLMGGLLILLFISTQNPSYFGAGVSVIFGVQAYKSAKNRRLGIVQPSKIRTVLEVGALILIVLLVAWQNNLKQILVEDPFLNTTIPAWIITAYLTVVFADRFTQNKRKRIAAIAGIFITISFGLFFLLFSIPIKEYFLGPFGRVPITNPEAKWQEFYSTTAHFSILLPTYPTYELKQHEAGVNSQITYSQDLYTARVSNARYMAERFTFSEVDLTSLDQNQILEAFVNSMVQELKNGRVVSSQFAKYQSNNAIDFLIQGDEASIRGRIIIVGEKMYRLTLDYNGQDFSDSDYSQFVNSFTVK